MKRLVGIHGTCNWIHTFSSSIAFLAFVLSSRAIRRSSSSSSSNFLFSPRFPSTTSTSTTIFPASLPTIFFPPAGPTNFGLQAHLYSFKFLNSSFLSFIFIPILILLSFFFLPLTNLLKTFDLFFLRQDIVQRTFSTENVSMRARDRVPSWKQAKPA